MLSVSGSGVRAPVSVSGNSDPLATSEGDQGVTFSQSPHQGFQQLHSPTGHDPHAHAEHQSTKADLQDRHLENRGLRFLFGAEVFYSESRSEMLPIDHVMCQNVP